MTKLIVALDMPRQEALELVQVFDADKLGDIMYKIGPHLMYYGLDWLRLMGHQPLLDAKLADIPSTMEAGVHAAFTLGIRWMTLGPGLSKEQVRAARRGQTNGYPKLWGVTTLTSGKEFVPSLAISRAAQLQLWGLDGAILPGEVLVDTRYEVGREFTLAVPGVRMTYDPALDQNQIISPAKACRDGADYIIVGRPITEAMVPVSRARHFLEAILSETSP